MSEQFIVPTIDRPGTFDALSTALPGEPLFPLKGSDRFGPPTVLHWVDLARAEGLRLTGDFPEGSGEYQQGEHLLQKATSAEQVAWAMQAYQKGHTAPEERRATYADDTRAGLPATEIDANRKAREARIRSSAALHNALSIAHEQAEMLAALGACPDETALIREGVEKLKAAAKGVDPRRGLERS